MHDKKQILMKRCLPGVPPDDLREGQFVTFTKRKLIKDKSSFTTVAMSHTQGVDLEQDSLHEEQSLEDETNCEGIPFRVLAVSWPWALFAQLEPGGGEGGPYIRDLRTVDCVRLNEEYINAIKHFRSYPPRQESHDGN